jgi:hypothetical protein
MVSGDVLGPLAIEPVASDMGAWLAADWFVPGEDESVGTGPALTSVSAAIRVVQPNLAGDPVDGASELLAESLGAGPFSGGDINPFDPI